MMSADRFERVGNRLKVHGDLELGMAEDLRKLCEHMLEECEGELIIDLSEVGYMHSLPMGVFTHLWVQASGSEREVRFVVSPRVAELFEKSGLGKVMKYQLPDS